VTVIFFLTARSPERAVVVIRAKRPFQIFPCPLSDAIKPLSNNVILFAVAAFPFLFPAVMSIIFLLAMSQAEFKKAVTFSKQGGFCLSDTFHRPLPAARPADTKSRKEVNGVQRKNLRTARFLNHIIYRLFAKDTDLLPINSSANCQCCLF